MPDAHPFQDIQSELVESIFSSYMNRADKVVVVMDTGYTVKAINAHGEQVLGHAADEIVGKSWLRSFVSHERREEVRSDYERLLRTGSQEPAKNKHTLTTKQGISGVFSWQHFLVQDTRRKARAILSVGEDISEQLLTAKILQRRNAILEALSMASDYFLTATPDVWEDNVIEILRQLGEARNSERVYVCKNRQLMDKRLGTFLKYEWKHTGETHVFRGEESGYRAFADVGLSRWVEIFERNEVICEEVSDIPLAERVWNFSPEVQSIVMIPVFVGEDWWGYLAFEDWQPGRECAPSELEALKAVALTFGQAIRRKRIEEELRIEKTTVELKVQQRTYELEKAKQAISEGLQQQKYEKARLTASIHSLSLGFVMTDTKKNVLLFNHAVSGILGGGMRQWEWGGLVEVLGEKFDLEGTYDTCLGEEREIVVQEVVYGDQYLRFYFTPIKLVEGDGSVIGVVILFDDISEEKRLQQSRDEFFAVASHELRTPLTAIRGNASILQDYFGEMMADSEVHEIVDDMYSSSVRLIEMVNEYLDISRMEVNKVAMEPERFELVGLVREAMHQLSSSAGEKGLAWELQVDEGAEHFVYTDRQRVMQVVINLLGNALKYTEAGGVYVKIEDVGDRVGVKVYDTGVGLAEEDRVHLFEKFARFGDRVYTRDATSGTGMGLYITRLIVEALRGNVYCEDSEPGKGSCFVVELPKG